jgi:hypothetical protein
MADYDFWKKQGLKPLFGEIDTERPDQKRFAGKLLIIGGNKGAFFAVANAMNEAHQMRVGEVRAIMPSSLKNQVPSTPEVYFAEAEKSGAFGRNALNDLLIQAEWAEAIVLIGDMGKNAETTMVFAEFMKHCDKPLFITRDAVDAVTPDVMNWAVAREGETSLLLTMPQLQKLLRTLYYPKVITLSMPTNQLIEALHKFTVSYELSIATFHNNQIIVAQHGEVVSEEIRDTSWTPITLWSGALSIHEAVLRLWNPNAETRKVLASALLYK